MCTIVIDNIRQQESSFPAMVRYFEAIFKFNRIVHTGKGELEFLPKERPDNIAVCRLNNGDLLIVYADGVKRFVSKTWFE